MRYDVEMTNYKGVVVYDPYAHLLGVLRPKTIDWPPSLSGAALYFTSLRLKLSGSLLFAMSNQPTKQKLWGGRFTGTTDPLYVCDRYCVVEELTLSVGCMNLISH
jgi:hypothetical protein